MAGGYGIAGFGGGLAQGLAGVLLQHRQEMRQKEQQDEDRKLREASLLFPQMFQLDLESGDFSRSEQYLSDIFPHLKGQLKKDSPFQYLGPLLQQPGTHIERTPQEIVQAQDKSAGTGTPLDQSMILAPSEEVPPPIQPTSIGRTVQNPATFFGRPILSPEQRIARKAAEAAALEGAQYQGRADLIKHLRSLGVDDDTLDRIGLREFGSSSASAYQSVAGEMPDGKPAFGVFNRRIGKYVDEAGQPLEGFRPRTTSASSTLGADRDAIAIEFFGKKAAQLTPEEMAKVNAELPKRAQGMSYARGTGTGQASYEKPIDVKVSQDTGLPVGSKSPEFAGQTVPTVPQQERGRSLDTLKQTMTRLTQLLDVLPSEQEGLSGLMPGGAMALRRRSNSPSGIADEKDPKRILSYREATAALDSNISAMLNVLARVRDEQRGTQTEKDAERAMDTLIKAQGSFYDPMGGDTRESAKARLRESFAALERSIAATPKMPKAGAPAGPQGMTIGPDGTVYVNGKPLPK